MLNIGASIGYQLLNLVLSFVSRTVFLQILGVGYLGINGLFNDVLSMLNMAELGLGTAMTYSMYKPLAENDHDTLAGLTQFYKKSLPDHRTYHCGHRCCIDPVFTIPD